MAADPNGLTAFIVDKNATFVSVGNTCSVTVIGRTKNNDYVAPNVGKTVTATSSNTGVATVVNGTTVAGTDTLTVTANIVITGLAPGNSTITLSFTDAASMSWNATINVEVIGPEERYLSKAGLKYFWDNLSIDTGKISNAAVTTDKIDWTTIGETVNGTTSTSVPINYARKYPDGRLICFQRYVWTNKSVSTAWGGCYSGNFMTPVKYAVSFTATPIVNATPNLTAGGNVWVASRGEDGFTSATKPGAFQLVRPTSTSGTSGYLDIVAYGYWK